METAGGFDDGTKGGGVVGERARAVGEELALLLMLPVLENAEAFRQALFARETFLAGLGLALEGIGTISGHEPVRALIAEPIAAQEPEHGADEDQPANAVLGGCGDER